MPATATLTSPLTNQEREAFYAAAMSGLRALDNRESSARRLGPDADTRWAQFAGALGAGDRIDILLRDAAGTWGSAFSPAECFGFFGLATDEPFGPDWVGLPEATAKKLLAATDRHANIESAAAALGIKVSAVSLPPIKPATKLVAAGGEALVALAKTFAGNPSLSWTDQVAVVAAKGAFRQLAGLAAVMTGGRARTTLVAPGADAANVLRAAGFAHIDAAVVSTDAEPDAAELAHTLGGK